MPTPTTARYDVGAAILTVLSTRKAASPTLLRAVYVARPGSFPETPCAYISGLSERISYNGQLRTRTFIGCEVTLVDTLIDASETEDRMTVLIDLLVDDFTAAVASIPGGRAQLQLTSITDADVVLTGDSGAVTYRGAVFGLGDGTHQTAVTEGRA